jgi:hypothetical protein
MLTLFRIMQKIVCAFELVLRCMLDSLWAVMVLKIRHIQPFEQIYGHLAFIQHKTTAQFKQCEIYLASTNADSSHNIHLERLNSEDFNFASCQHHYCRCACNNLISWILSIFKIQSDNTFFNCVS